MHRAQGTRSGPTFYHDGDVTFRGALRDRAHVHTGRAQRVEDFRRDTRRARHSVADDREDRQVRIDLYSLDLSLFQLPLERLTDQRGRARALLERDGATDRVLGAALGDEDD